MLGLWALLTLIGVFFAVWKGYGGHEFAATLTSFAFLFLVMLLFAARGAETILATRLGAGAAYLLGAALFLVYLIYALGTNTFTLGRAATAAVLVFVPLAVAASAERKPAGTWQDFAIIVGIWVAVKPFPNHWGFSMSHWLWPFPGGQLAYAMTVLLCLNVSLAAFVLLRHTDGIGYSIGWGRNWGFFILASFLAFACIAMPLGTGMRFIQWAPRWGEWESLPLTALAILFFTAWPERNCRLVDGFGSLRVFPHHQSGISQLALRRAGLHCRNFLRLDVAPNGLHLCLRDCPRGGGHDVALPVPHSVTQGRAVATVGGRLEER